MSEPFNIYVHHEDYPAHYLVPTKMISGETLLSHYPEYVAERKARDKHLLDTELAAEFQRINHDFSIVTEGYSFYYFGSRYSSEDQVQQDLRTIERFATTDHYDMD